MTVLPSWAATATTWLVPLLLVELLLPVLP